MLTIPIIFLKMLKIIKNKLFKKKFDHIIAYQYNFISGGSINKK